MNKFIYLSFIIPFFSIQLFAQNNYQLPQNVINDFSKSVHYSWNSPNTKDAFRAAIILGLRKRGINSQFEITKVVQTLTTSKSSRDLVIGALFDYAPLVGLEFKQLLLNMDIPSNSASVLASYAQVLDSITYGQNNSGDDLERKENYVVIAEEVSLKRLPKYNITWADDPFCMYGDQVVATKEDQGFLYCEFKNPKTNKIKKGWIDRNLLILSSDYKAPDKTTNVTTKFTPLLQLDGLNSSEDYHDGQGVFFKRPIVTAELKKIMGVDYDQFEQEFLSDNKNGNIEIRDKVLFVGLSNSNPPEDIVLIIDILNQKSFLFKQSEAWYNHHAVYKYYGEKPFSSNIIAFLKNKIEQETKEANSGYFPEERKIAKNEAQMLQEFLTAYSN